MQNLIGVTEAAAILGIKPRGVQHRITAGTLIAHKLPGKTGAYVLDRADVEAARDGIKAAS